MQHLSRTSVFQGIVLLAVLIVLAVGFILFFRQIDTSGNSLGIDNIFYSFEGWDIYYEVDEGLRNPPWSVLVLIPLGQVSSKTAWGIIAYFTVIATVLSVPTAKDRRFYLLSVFVVVLSFPSVRNIADANLEGVLIAGALLTVYGFKSQRPLVLTLGLLWITVKPQACFVLLPILAWYTLMTWPPRKWLLTAGVVLAFVVPTMLWRGREWLAAVEGTYQAGTLVDISLSAALNRTGVVPEVVIWMLGGVLLVATVWIALRSDHSLSREKAGLLIVTSLLLAPYAAGNTMVTVLAIGVMPLFINKPSLGIILILMINAPFLFVGQTDILIYYQGYWATITLIVAWLLFAWRVYQYEIKQEVTEVSRLEAM